MEFELDGQITAKLQKNAKLINKYLNNLVDEGTSLTAASLLAATHMFYEHNLLCKNIEHNIHLIVELEHNMELILESLKNIVKNKIFESKTIH